MSRRVTRVLVMVEYEGNDESEVFDLAALTAELHEQKAKFADITLRVSAGNDYGKYDSEKHAYPTKVEATWSSWGSLHIGQSGHLQDIINSTLPDSPEVKRMRRQAKKTQDEAYRLFYKASQAKIEQVAGLRRLNSVATVKLEKTPLAEVGEPALEGRAA